MATLASRQQESEPDDRAAAAAAAPDGVRRHSARCVVRADAAVRPRVPAGRQAAGSDDQRRAPVDRPGDRAGLAERARGSAQVPDPRGPEHIEHDRGDQVAADRVERARQVLHPQPHPDRQRVRSRIRRSRPDCSSTRSCSRARSGSPALRGTSTATGATSAPAPAAERTRVRPRRSRTTVRSSGTPFCRCSAPVPRSRARRHRCAANVACYRNPAPNLNSAKTGAGP